MTVVVVGDIVTDIVAVHRGPIAADSDTPASITVSGGGSAANTAAWLAAAGVRVALVGVVGDDPAGDERVTELESAGVDCTGVRRTRASTGSVIVLANGVERSMLCDRGANLRLAPSDVSSALPGATHLHLSGYTLFDAGSRSAGRFALDRARGQGLTTSVDAASAAPLGRVGPTAFASWIDGVDVLFANLDEAAVLAPTPAAPDVLAAALTRVAVHVVVKLGPAGALWAGPHGLARAPAQPATLLDPTGAGDAFTAGFLAGWLAGESEQTVLVQATSYGAQAVARIGGRPPNPGSTEIRASPGR